MKSDVTKTAKEIPATIPPQRTTISYPQTKTAPGEHRNPLKKLQQHSKAKTLVNNGTKMGKKNSSFCLHHPIPQAGMLSAKMEIPLRGKGEWGE